MGMTIDEALDHLHTYSSTLGSGQTPQAQHEEAKRVAIDVMRKYQKQEKALDKVRSEIEQEYTKLRNKSDMWNERACGLGTALEIIDKYKAESEE